MSAFFSGTDWSNLNDRALESDYFMMLIVNFAGNYVAKVAFKAKRADNSKTILEFANNADNHRAIEIDTKVAKEALVVMDCEIILEPVDDGIPDSFKERYQKVKVESSKPAYNYNSYGSARNTSIGFNQNARPNYIQGSLGVDKSDDSWDTEPFYNVPPASTDLTTKPISAMTDEEFNRYDSVLSNSKIPVVEKFNNKSATRFLNCVMSNTTNIYDTGDPMIQIRRVAKKIENGKVRKYDFIRDLEDKHLGDSFDKLFPKNNTLSYIDMLSVSKALLSDNRKEELVRSIINALDNEMERASKKIGNLIND